MFIFLIVLLILAVSGGAALQYVRSAINKDAVSPLEVLNEGGATKALVVYQQGLSSAPRDAAYAFAYGLQSAGWRVEVTSASPQAPINLTDYKLLVLAYPIYGARPGETITRYVDRLGDMHQTPTVTIDCRWSNAIETIMKQKVETQNGTVIQTLLAGKTDLQEAASQIAP
jgi:menaquinone-dependent protoporphyrinogen IX oxidase